MASLVTVVLALVLAVAVGIGGKAAAPSASPPAASFPSAPAGKTVDVSTIPSLLETLADDSVGQIVVADGTYPVSPASLRRADSLWIGSAFAARSNPVLVRAATMGGVTFDGGGSAPFGCISFEDGAHDQTWSGFDCADGEADSTGVVTFGGYPGLAAPYAITLDHFTILASCTGNATSASAPTTDHAVYISEAVGGPHDLTFTGLTVDGRGGLASAFHFNHSDAADQNGWDVHINGLTVTGTQQAIILWDPTIHDVTVDGATITGALRYAVRYEAGTNILLVDVTSSASGAGGFYSTLGSDPPGVTFSHDSLD